MSNIKVYPWQNVAWDIAIDQSMNESALENMTWNEAQEAVKTKLATCIGEALLSGKLQALNSDGDPIKLNGLIKEDILKPNKLYVSPKHVNPWLEQNGYLYEWNPQKTQTQIKPPLRSDWAEHTILGIIRAKGYDPLKLKKTQTRHRRYQGRNT